MRLVMIAATALIGLSLGFGCSNDDEAGGAGGTGAVGNGAGPECEAIIEACHLVDMGDPGEVNQCHEVGHEGTLDQCKAEMTRCVALCHAYAEDAGIMYDGGHEHDGGEAGLGGMGGMGGKAGASGAGGTP